MAIVCLGWGSLIWDPQGFRTLGEWENDGPSLPLEFARQSGGGRMTLVITDGKHMVPVLWARLDVPNIDQAVQALADREGTSTANIGRCPLPLPRHRCSDRICAWAEAQGHSGVVW